MAIAVKVGLLFIVYSFVKYTYFLTDNILEQKSKISIFQENLQKHKDDAQNALEYYRNKAIITQSQYTKITSLLSKENRTKGEENQLKRLQDSFSAFVSADYMMSFGVNLHSQLKLIIR